MSRPSSHPLWVRFQDLFFEFPACRISLDLSRLTLEDDFLARMARPMERALAAMRDLEAGSIANPDEGRRVGHYWLRNAALAPTPELRQAIDQGLAAIKTFVAQVHSGQIAGQTGRFEHLLVVGIGGSALGPQLVADALGQPGSDRLKVWFLDNTDPDGIDRTLATLGTGQLGKTLVLVVSKSGSTPETRNGMLEVQDAYRAAGLAFNRHAVAVTQFDPKASQLHRKALEESWLAQFEMWDWVGGRTSVMSSVGLLPAALQGLDIDAFLGGARACDETTRAHDLRKNPAALLALAWYHAGNGRGSRSMVVLPYKDRLGLFSKYLQQLVMESLGKEADLDGRIVRQGLTVYGNKGSTDQHAYVQQLREGLHDFFVTFVEVLRDRRQASLEVEPGITSGDYLQGFLLGTRAALFEKRRESMTITIPDLDAFTLGALIALFERTVGLYANLVNINAYHQPGVEAGKKAAAAILQLKKAITAHLRAHPGQPFDAETLAQVVGDAFPPSAPAVAPDVVFKLCEHLAANPPTGIQRTPGATPTAATYRFVAG